MSIEPSGHRKYAANRASHHSHRDLQVNTYRLLLYQTTDTSEGTGTPHHIRPATRPIFSRHNKKTYGICSVLCCLQVLQINEAHTGNWLKPTRFGGGYKVFFILEKSTLVNNHRANDGDVIRFSNRAVNSGDYISTLCCGE